MTAYEYVQTLLEVKKERKFPHETDEAAAFDVAQLISGSFIYPLYEALFRNDFDMDEITQHLESLYDSANHFGLVYFIFILANAVNITVPIQFTETCANDTLVPTLSAAIIEDWLEYAAISEVIENNE